MARWSRRREQRTAKGYRGRLSQRPSLVSHLKKAPHIVVDLPDEPPSPTTVISGPSTACVLAAGEAARVRARA